MPQRILHVDDDGDILNIVSLSLETFGNYEVVSCISGKDALEKLDKFTPDLALLDFTMPEMDGEQLFSKIKNRYGLNCFPVIFVTAEALEATKKRLLAMGALEVIPKPFNPITLPDQIEKIVDKARGD